MDIRRDLHSYIKPVSAIPVNSTNTTAISLASTIIDALGFNVLEFILSNGGLSVGSYVPRIIASQNADMSNPVTLSGADLIGSITGATLLSTDAANTYKSIGVVISIYRYYQLFLESPGGASVSGFTGAFAILSNPDAAGQGFPNPNINQYS